MSESTQASLTVVASPCLSPGTRFSLGRERCRIGRSARNELRIDAVGVADAHAVIELRYGRFILEVLTDEVLTSINREPVRQSRRLVPGDTLEIAETSFHFNLGGTPKHAPRGAQEPTLSPGDSATDEADQAETPAGSTRVLATSRFALSDLMAVVSAEDQRRDFERIKIAFDAVSRLLNTFELAELCKGMLEAVFELVPAEHGAVLVRRPDGSLWTAHERSSPGRGSVPAVSQTVIDQVLARKEAVLAMDIGADDRFSGSESIQAAHVRSLMAVPLVAGEEVLGVLHVVNTSRVGAFRESDLDLVSALGVGAGLVLSNNRLYRQLEEALERQVAFNQILKNTVEERTVELRQKNRELSETLARLEATQDQIIAQEKLASLGTLTSGIAHEMLNPLNFVNNFALIVTERVDELRSRLDPQQVGGSQWPEIEELLGDIHNGSQVIRKHGARVEKVVVGMRQLAKAEGGERARADLNDVLSNLVSALRHDEPVHGPRIVTTLDPSMGPVDVVVRDLSHALLNMLHNALQAVHARLEPPPGWTPEVGIRSEDHGDHVLVVIRDNGEGIPRAILHRVFEPFFTTKPTDQGIGLGLSVAHDVIVKMHGGSIVIDSEPGEFTELRVTIPRVRGRQ